MDIIIATLVNQVAPLLVQLLGALVLAIASALLLKAAPVIADFRTQQGLAIVAALSKVGVHTAEVEGLGKTGAEKAVAARQYVNGELAKAGVTTVKAADVEGTVKGAVEAAFQNEIGPGPLFHPAPVVVGPVVVTEPPAGPEVPNLAPVETPLVVDAPTPTA